MHHNIREKGYSFSCLTLQIMIFVCQFYKINFKMYVKVYLLCFVSVMYSELNPENRIHLQTLLVLKFQNKIV